MQELKPSETVGIFDDQQQAVDAVQALMAANFRPEQIVIMVRDWRGRKLIGPRVELQQVATTGALRGALIGGISGLAAGAIAGLLLTMNWPYTLLLAILGTALGAAAGCYVGPFIAMSNTERGEHAEHTEQGRTVVIVRAPQREDEARAVMVDHGAYDFSMSSD
jgi:hypothetical protein